MALFYKAFNVIVMNVDVRVLDGCNNLKMNVFCRWLNLLCKDVDFLSVLVMVKLWMTLNNNGMMMIINLKATRMVFEISCGNSLSSFKPEVFRMP